MKKKYLYTAIMLFAILVAGMGLTGWYVSQTQEQTDTKLDDIRQMTFTHTDKDGKEKEIPLTKICEMKDTTTLSTMKRDAQTRYITVSCGVDEDHNVTLLGNKIQKSMDKLNVPEGYHIEMTGEEIGRAHV